MKGVDLMTVKELLGHSSVVMTERYSHLADRHKANAVAQMERFNLNLVTNRSQSGNETEAGNSGKLVSEAESSS